MAEPGGTMWLSVPEAARHLGISERAVRKRITTGALDAERDGPGPWRVRVGTASRAVPHGSEGGTEGGTTSEPIEAAYRVTPAEIEQAVSRTSAQYMGDLRTMLAEVGKVYAGQLAAKDQTIAAKDAALEAKDHLLVLQIASLSAKDEAIAELRRRAEAAEAEVSLHREEGAQRPQALSVVPSGQEEVEGAREGTPGAWGRVRRWWHG